MEKPFVFVIGFNKCATSAIYGRRHSLLGPPRDSVWGGAERIFRWIRAISDPRHRKRGSGWANRPLSRNGSDLAAWQKVHVTTAERMQNRPTLHGSTVTRAS